MNVLLTGIGGPAGICFAKSLSEVKEIELIGANAEQDAAGEKFVKKFYLLPFANSPLFLDSLKKIIANEKINFLIPLVDEELPIISKNRKLFANCKILISPHKTIEYTNDKERLYDVLGSFLPKKFSLNDSSFPLFAKPKIGRGSRGIHIINNKNELERLHSPNYIYQELLTGPEITVDALFDFSGNIISIAQRIRAKVKQGISVSGQIIDNKQIFNDIKDISKILEFCGPINFQFMKSIDKYKLIEINARSSGGMGITIQAGLDSPKLSLKLLQNKIIAQPPKVKLGVFNNFEEIIKRQQKINKND